MVLRVVGVRLSSRQVTAMVRDAHCRPKALPIRARQVMILPFPHSPPSPLPCLVCLTVTLFAPYCSSFGLSLSLCVIVLRGTAGFLSFRTDDLPAWTKCSCTTPATRTWMRTTSCRYILHITSTRDACEYTLLGFSTGRSKARVKRLASYSCGLVNPLPPPPLSQIKPPSPPIYIGNAPSHTHTQAFITEMTDIAQMKWLDEYKTSSDKKALVAKVRLLPITQNVLQQ